MKLGINIPHVKGHLLTWFSNSEVKDQGHGDIKCNFAAEAYISTAWRRG